MDAGEAVTADGDQVGVLLDRTRGQHLGRGPDPGHQPGAQPAGRQLGQALGEGAGLGDPHRGADLAELREHVVGGAIERGVVGLRVHEHELGGVERGDRGGALEREVAALR